MLKRSASLLGLLNLSENDWLASKKRLDLTVYADFLSQTRAVAVENKDFTEVDRLKAAFVSAGLEVRMSKAGVELVVDWPAAYSQMLAEKNDGRFERLTGVDRVETVNWLKEKLNSICSGEPEWE